MLLTEHTCYIDVTIVFMALKYNHFDNLTNRHFLNKNAKHL